MSDELVLAWCVRWPDGSGPRPDNYSTCGTRKLSEVLIMWIEVSLIINANVSFKQLKIESKNIRFAGIMR